MKRYVYSNENYEDEIDWVVAASPHDAFNIMQESVGCPMEGDIRNEIEEEGYSEWEGFLPEYWLRVDRMYVTVSASSLDDVQRTAELLLKAGATRRRLHVVSSYPYGRPHAESYALRAPTEDWALLPAGHIASTNY